MEALTYLAYAQKYFTDIDIPCRLDRATEKYPVDMLIFPLDDMGEIYPVDGIALMMFFARPDAAFCRELKIRLMHLTAYLGKAEGEAVNELREYFANINSQLPLGSFDVDAEGSFYYRYNLPVTEEAEAAQFLRQVSAAYAIMRSCMAMFLMRVDEIRRGALTAKRAVEEMGRDTARVADAVHSAINRRR